MRRFTCRFAGRAGAAMLRGVKGSQAEPVAGASRMRLGVKDVRRLPGFEATIN